MRIPLHLQCKLGKAENIKVAFFAVLSSNFVTKEFDFILGSVVSKNAKVYSRCGFLVDGGVVVSGADDVEAESFRFTLSSLSGMPRLLTFGVSTTIVGISWL